MIAQDATERPGMGRGRLEGRSERQGSAGRCTGRGRVNLADVNTLLAEFIEERTVRRVVLALALVALAAGRRGPGAMPNGLLRAKGGGNGSPNFPSASFNRRSSRSSA